MMNEHPGRASACQNYTVTLITA